MSRIKSCFLTAVQLIFLAALAFSILCAPAKACTYAALALQLWFEKMIPSLFPFMILSGLIVRLDLGRLMSVPVYPVLGRLYRINKTMCTALLMGFLFGFPLGAKTVAEAYDLKQLSKPQAQFLLSFCNNIGPVYLLSFALPLLGLSDGCNRTLRATVILIFFGLPLLYGLILRYTVYRKLSFHTEYLSASSAPSHRKSACPDRQSTSANTSFIPALDASVTSACAAITRLSGYMIFFIVCNLPFEQLKNLPDAILPEIFSSALSTFLSPILEITSGLALSKDALPAALSMTFLTFGGLSCFAQTYTCIRDTDLSFGNYCFHKLLQSAIAFCLYAVLFSVFSDKPPLL